MLTLPIFPGEQWERCRRQIKRPERVAAVDKIEDQRKPEDFIGHRNRARQVLSAHRSLTSVFGLAALPVADKAEVAV